jgi:hypothetical protein
VACAAFTTLLFGAIASLFTPWGLPALTLAFWFGTLAFTVMKRTSSRLVEVEVEDITTPEEQLKRMRGERGSGAGATPSTAPTSISRARPEDGRPLRAPSRRR